MILSGMSADVEAHHRKEVIQNLTFFKNLLLFGFGIAVDRMHSYLRYAHGNDPVFDARIPPGRTTSLIEITSGRRLLLIFLVRFNPWSAKISIGFLQHIFRRMFVARWVGILDPVLIVLNWVWLLSVSEI